MATLEGFRVRNFGVLKKVMEIHMPATLPNIQQF